MKLLILVLLLLQHPIDGKESVIFEQLGTLIGATSYLHVHLDINLNAIQEQLMRYSDVLQHQFTNVSTTVAYLTNYMTFNTENRTEEKMVKYQMQASALSFIEIASLHHREVGELNRLVMALQAILPDVEAKEKQRRKNMEINLPIRPFESQLHEDDQEDDPKSDSPDRIRISQLRVE
jgi:anaerobic ribonucleoside-triphosphate reductase